MTSYGPEREADRIRVIIETLAFAHPDLPLKDAVPMIHEIEARTAKLESPHVAAFESDDPITVARWIDTQEDIKDLCVSKKINAIKETRARFPLAAHLRKGSMYLGLREAKDGVEAWVRGDHIHP